jgi:hypothetical protein
MAILARDPSGERDDTWADQINQKQGADQLRFNHDTKQVEQGSDGLPEMVLHLQLPGTDADEANTQYINLGTGLETDELARQVREGWRVGDLADLGGAFSLSGPTLVLDASAAPEPTTMIALAELVGQKRIICLYDNYINTNGERGRLTITEIVAVRILSVDPDSAEIVVQPTVLALRAAVTNVPFGVVDANDPFLNPYIYKISLTR